MHSATALAASALLVTIIACGSETTEPTTPGNGDGGASGGSDASSTGDGASGSVSACVAAKGACVCFSPCGKGTKDRADLVASCAAPPGAPGCAEPYCCVPDDSAPDAGADAADGG